MYFNKVKLNDEIYSLVYGNGVVCYVLEKEFRLSGSYMMQVQYEKEKVYYTEDGIPNWCKVKGDCQTAYYKKDNDRPEMDFATSKRDILTPKKIAKLKERGELEMRVPSGAWMNVDVIPVAVFLQALKAKSFYIFRKA